MKFFFLIVVCVLWIDISYAQTTNIKAGKIVVEFIKEKKSRKANIKAEVKSFFELDSVWVKSIEKKFNQSIRIDSKAKKGRYLVSVRFVITKDRTVSDVLCENDPGFGLCEAVVKEVKNVPRWGRCQ